MNNRQNGFTLVELAIALMVIGLLIGGVLKGQELIENAKIVRIAQDYTGVKTARMIFENTYGGVPGDFKYPARIPNCTTSPCNLPGDDNGLIEGSPGHDVIPGAPYNPHTYSDSRESKRFWIHLETAGLAHFQLRSDEFPIPVTPLDAMSYTAWGYRHVTFGDDLPKPTNFMLVQYVNNSAGGHLLNRAITSRKAMAIDSKVDDGRPFSGDARAMGPYNGGVALPPDCADTGDLASNQYNTASNQKECQIAIALD